MNSTKNQVLSHSSVRWQTPSNYPEKSGLHTSILSKKTAEIVSKAESINSKPGADLDDLPLDVEQSIAVDPGKQAPVLIATPRDLEEELSQRPAATN